MPKEYRKNEFLRHIKPDAPVKSPQPATPVKTEVQNSLCSVTSGFRENDGENGFQAFREVVKPDPTVPEKFKRIDLSAICKEMPPFVARNHPRFKEWTGYTGRTMANLDSLKQTGDIMKVMLGNIVAYERNSLVRWLESRSRILCEGVSV